MTNSLNDISDKIEKPFIEVSALIDGISQSLQISFVLVRAKARDIVFSMLNNVPTRRATLDVDFVIHLRSWEEYQSFKENLLQTMECKQYKKIPHRFLHNNGTIIDIVPFGDIEDPKGSIQWQDDRTILSTIGFEDILLSAIQIRIQRNPVLEISVATAAGLALMKFISWKERYPERKKDAEDLFFFMTKYIDAGNDQRLYDKDRDILDDEGFDYDKTSPRLLGRDMALIANPETNQVIQKILDEETNEITESRLVQDMIRGSNNDFDKTLTLLRQLQLGYTEKRMA